MSSVGAEMNIGELARRSGVPSTALRYYEKAGLLPESRRTSSGYRAFQPDTLPRLAFIRAAQSVGLTLAEIREVISIRDGGAAPCAHVLELIERHRTEVGSAALCFAPRPEGVGAGNSWRRLGRTTFRPSHEVRDVIPT